MTVSQSKKLRWFERGAAAFERTFQLSIHGRVVSVHRGDWLRKIGKLLEEEAMIEVVAQALETRWPQSAA